jgi:hypothetical protein
VTFPVRAPYQLGAPGQQFRITEREITLLTGTPPGTDRRICGLERLPLRTARRRIRVPPLRPRVRELAAVPLGNGDPAEVADVRAEPVQPVYLTRVPGPRSAATARTGNPAGQRVDGGKRTLSPAANIEPNTGPCPWPVRAAAPSVAVRGKPTVPRTAPTPRTPSAIRPWTPRHSALQRYKAIQGDTRRDSEETAR